MLVTGIIHLLPLAGVLGGARIAALYRVDVSDPNLEILLRHRAVLFGLLGAFLVAAAFRSALQPVAFIAGLISVVSFLALALLVGDYNAQIQRVVAADVVALVGLAIGGVALLISGRT